MFCGILLVQFPEELNTLVVVTWQVCVMLIGQWMLLQCIQPLDTFLSMLAVLYSGTQLINTQLRNPPLSLKWWL